MPKCVLCVCHVFAGAVLDFDALVAPHARRVATSAYADMFPRVAVDRDDAATLMYTSGTTGLPKGVVQTHRSILAQMYMSEPVQILAEPCFGVSASTISQPRRRRKLILAECALRCFRQVRRRGDRGRARQGRRDGLRAQAAPGRGAQTGVRRGTSQDTLTLRSSYDSMLDAISLIA